MTPQKLYVADSGANAILSWPTAAKGNIAPAGILKSSSFAAVCGVALDAAGNIWVSDSINTAIYMFPAGATGTGAAAHAFVGAATTLNSPVGLTFDAGGNLWVANSSGPTVLKWSAAQVAALLAGGESNVAPAITLSYSGFSQPCDVTIDSTGRIIVADIGAALVYVFPSAASGSAAPSFSVTVAPDFIPTGLALDATGRLWAVNVDTNTAVLLDLSDCSSGAYTIVPDTAIFFGNGGLALDAFGNPWIVSANGAAIENWSRNGNKLLAAIAGPATMLQNPLFLKLSAPATPPPSPSRTLRIADSPLAAVLAITDSPLE